MIRGCNGGGGVPMRVGVPENSTGRRSPDACPAA
jgi:hypothetical protein